MLKSAFAAADTDCKGTLDRDELEAIISGYGSAVSAPAPAREGTTIGSADKQKRRRMLNGWQVMYCGGAAPLVAQLQQISEKYQVGLKVESFAL